MILMMVIIRVMEMIMMPGRLLGLWSPGARRGLMRWRGTGRPGSLDNDDDGDDDDDDDDDDNDDGDACDGDDNDGGDNDDDDIMLTLS